MSQELPYHEEKRALRDRLGAIAAECQFVQRELGVDLSDVLDKVRQGLSDLDRQRVTIAVFGAVSDGKSTILSALTRRMDIPIAPEPTTNEVRIYEAEDWALCDTPGLFSEHLEHDDRTRKYISEAHLILFVMDAMNPLKESHHETVRWLLKDLGKQEATVFILNKMDKVADLESPEDFEQRARLKADAVRETLRLILDREIDPPVLAIAADPFAKKLGYWVQREAEYQRLSHLSVLERHVREQVRSACQKLIVAAGLSVVRYAVLRATAQIQEMSQQIEPTLRIFNSRVSEVNADLERLERHVIEAYAAIKSDILERRKEFFLQLDACETLDQAVASLQREVGKDGHILNQSLDVIIRKHTQALGQDFGSVMEQMERSIDVHENMMMGLGKAFSNPVIRGALESLRSTSAKQLSQGILWLRDSLGLPFRFKPWGAIKLGRFVKLFAWLGPIIEGGEVLANWLAERRLRQTVTEAKNLLEEGFQEFLEGFSQDFYVQTYFPHLSRLREVAEQMQLQRENCAALSAKLLDAELRLKKLVP